MYPNMEQEKNNSLTSWILLTGLLTATLDAILALLINYKVPVAAIFKFIASGLFGGTAFNMGTSAILYGVLIHYCIAFVWATTFFLLYTRMLSLLKYRIILIVTIGLFIWLVMNLAVLPLSAAHLQPLKLKGILENMAALILAFGMPVTVIAGQFYHK